MTAKESGNYPACTSVSRKRRRRPITDSYQRLDISISAIRHVSLNPPAGRLISAAERKTAISGPDTGGPHKWKRVESSCAYLSGLPVPLQGYFPGLRQVDS